MASCPCLTVPLPTLHTGIHGLHHILGAPWEQVVAMMARTHAVLDDPHGTPWGWLSRNLGPLGEQVVAMMRARTWAWTTRTARRPRDCLSRNLGPLGSRWLR